MYKKLVKLVSVLLMLAVVTGLCACLDEFDDYDYDYDYGYDDESGEPSETTAETYIRSDFDADRNPYYSMLTAKEKDIYSQLYEELSKGSQKFECKVKGVSADQLTKAIDAVLNDHPELFWIDNQYEYTYDPDDGSIQDISFDFFDFANTPDKLQNAKVAFEKAADDILDGARSQPFMVERERAIHDYICKNTTYDESAPYNQSAYSVIVLHRSVCAGYSRAFQYLMNRAGLTCYYVPGTTTDSSIAGEDGAHAWNIVYLDGEYYNIDVLWDDTASETYGESVYPFFNLPDGEFLYHARVEMALKLPKCTGTRYKYSNYFGKTVEAGDLVFEDAA